MTLRRSRPARLLAALAGASLVLAGCASGGDPEPTPEPTPTAQVQVTGSFGSVPVVAFEPPLELADSSTTVVLEGEGRELVEGGPVLLALTAYDGHDGELVDGRDPAVPRTMTLTREDVGEDLHPVLLGASEGSRILLQQPISEDGTDRMLLLVLDVLHTRAHGEAAEPREGLPTVSLDQIGTPEIDVPDEAPPTELVVAPLIRGEGRQVRPGQEVILQYAGVSWESGEPYDSTWEAGKVPRSVPLGDAFSGLRDGLVDQHVGSQVMLVIPPAQAQGTDTLVLVVDILAALGGDETAVVPGTPSPSESEPTATEDATEEATDGPSAEPTGEPTAEPATSEGGDDG